MSYVDQAGVTITDRGERERIRALAIPPAWTDVWICPLANGHLQAVGTDAAGRRQYLYHPRWSELRSREKFARMETFADHLPLIRERVATLLADASSAEPASRDRVLALAVRLLDRGWFRIGTEAYAVANGTYGLVTLRREHVTLEPPDAIRFLFPAKHGIEWDRRIEDALAFAALTHLTRRRTGPDHLLVTRHGRTWSPIAADDVNDFLRESSGIDCTAKDFRTWHGTVLCATALASQAAVQRAAGREPARTKTARRREIAQAVRETAAFLGNTPAVARASYIDPRLFDRYRDGRTIQPGIERVLRLEDVTDIEVQGVLEAATRKLLEDRSDVTIARAAERAIDASTTAPAAIRFEHRSPA